MGDVWPGVADVSIHFSHDANVLIAVEKRVFLVSDYAAPTAVGGLVCFQAGMRQYHDQSLAVFIIGSNRNMLFSDQLREFGWRTRLRKP